VALVNHRSTFLTRLVALCLAFSLEVNPAFAALPLLSPVEHPGSISHFLSEALDARQIASPTLFEGSVRADVLHSAPVAQPDASANNDTPLMRALKYVARAINFGTSGMRGLVKDWTNMESYINTRAFFDYALDPSVEGHVEPGDVVYIAEDLRPSADESVTIGELERGQIAQAVTRAIEDAGCKVVNIGRLPTPALAYYAKMKGKACVMITGSHIPFDRNGIKFYKTNGEVLKSDEAGILARVQQTRDRIYNEPFAQSIFNEQGMFRADQRRPLPVPGAEAREARELYIQRYVDFFGGQKSNSLAGKNILVFQHSAVGRDIMVEVLKRLGANAIPVGRTEHFIAIDTEDIQKDTLDLLQGYADEAAVQGIHVDAIVSGDGDTDRPMVLGLQPSAAEPRRREVRFFGGDLLGLVTAKYLGAGTVALPISANDAIDIECARLGIPVTKTKIGSPYVIAAENQLNAAGRRNVLGWEANGGFIMGSDVERNGKVLISLPTRDAMLPILSALFSAREDEDRQPGSAYALTDVFDRLPKRYGKAGLIDNYPVEMSKLIIRTYSPSDEAIQQVDFKADGVLLHLANGGTRTVGLEDPLAKAMLANKAELESFYKPELGFGRVTSINTIDGVRIFFDNGDIAHMRPSGNAPQLRIYAIAPTQERANAIVQMALADDGIYRSIETHMNQKLQKAAALNAFRKKPQAVLLDGAFKGPQSVPPYLWGGHLIARLLGRIHPRLGELAEYWLGAHDSGSATTVVEGCVLTLMELIDGAPVQVLGEAVARKFNNRHPYLMKLLHAVMMLSLQAHPNPTQASNGYKEERQMGIAVNIGNYKDPSAKPEIAVVLEDLWMLHGFRKLAEIANILEDVQEFRTLMPDFRQKMEAAGLDPQRQKDLLMSLYSRVMDPAQLSNEESNRILGALVARVTAVNEANRLARVNGMDEANVLTKDMPDFWAARAAQTFLPSKGNWDRGMYSIYLLNLMFVPAGKAIYQPAGTPHAYLEGFMVEDMANSDNVLRAGFTNKKIDIPELLKTLTFATGKPPIIEPQAVSATESVFRTPAEEFEMSRIQIDSGKPHQNGQTYSLETLIVTSADEATVIKLKTEDQELELKQGSVVGIPAGLAYTIEATGPAILFKSAVPTVDTVQPMRELVPVPLIGVAPLPEIKDSESAAEAIDALFGDHDEVKGYRNVTKAQIIDLFEKYAQGKKEDDDDMLLDINVFGNSTFHVASFLGMMRSLLQDGVPYYLSKQQQGEGLQIRRQADVVASMFTVELKKSGTFPVAQAGAFMDTKPGEGIHWTPLIRTSLSAMGMDVESFLVAAARRLPDGKLKIIFRPQQSPAETLPEGTISFDLLMAHPDMKQLLQTFLTKELINLTTFVGTEEHVTMPKFFQASARGWGIAAVRDAIIAARDMLGPGIGPLVWALDELLVEMGGTVNRNAFSIKGIKRDQRKSVGEQMSQEDQVAWFLGRYQPHLVSQIVAYMMKQVALIVSEHGLGGFFSRGASLREHTPVPFVPFNAAIDESA